MIGSIHASFNLMIFFTIYLRNKQAVVISCVASNCFWTLQFYTGNEWGKKMRYPVGFPDIQQQIQGIETLQVD